MLSEVDALDGFDRSLLAGVHLVLELVDDLLAGLAFLLLSDYYLVLGIYGSDILDLLGNDHLSEGYVHLIDDLIDRRTAVLGGDDYQELIRTGTVDSKADNTRTKRK